MTNEEAIKRIQQDLDVNKKYLSKEYKEALNMAIEALSADAVSREFYEEAIKANHGLAQELCELKASADRPSGVWQQVEVIDDDEPSGINTDASKCSVCGAIQQSHYWATNYYNYCPSCGARMEKEE